MKSPMKSISCSLALLACNVLGLSANDQLQGVEVLNMNPNWTFAREAQAAKDAFSSSSSDEPASGAFDGRRESYWSTPAKRGSTPYPHWIREDFGAVRDISGIKLLPRVDSEDGRINEFDIQLSNDGKKWSEAIYSGNLENRGQWQEFNFEKTHQARYLRLLAKSSHKENSRVCALAEMLTLPQTRANGDLSGLALDAEFDDSQWESVHLPHSPTIEPKEFRSHWQGICWYRKQFYAEPAWQGKQVVIRFEAVMQQAQVWVNGQRVANHDGGYLPFSCDVSELLHYDGVKENLIVVRADNRNHPNIPPGQPLNQLDFTYQGGIYRDVTIEINDKLHISDAVAANQVAGGGIFVSYPKIDEEEAQVAVKTHVVNEHAKPQSFELHTTISDASGKIIAEQRSQKTLAASSNEHIEQQFTVQKPQLWSPESPTLYTVNSTVIRDGKTCDHELTRIGLRTIEWRNDGFFLNGKRVVLNGANRHQDYIYVGNAASNSMQRLDAIKLKEAGFNNVRAGHYPLAQSFMDACDELGLTVIACIPGWHCFRDNETFINNSYQDIRDLIRLERNHPSVILYEPILNESRYSEDYARESFRISKEEDPNCFTACDYKYPAHEIYDVNYKVPDGSKPFFTREWGDNQRGISRAADRWGDWANRNDENSMVWQSLARQQDLNGDGYWDWYGVNANPTSAGYALWIGIDHNRGFRGNIARCGIFGLDRYPKFCHYFLQAQRDPKVLHKGIDSGPMVFIASYWRENSQRDISVYSNAQEVKLYLNEKLIDTRTADSSYTLTTHDKTKGAIREEKALDHVPHPIFTFAGVQWQAGTLRAEAYIDGKLVAEHEVRTPLAASQIAITMDHPNDTLTADGSDMAMLFISAVDENGTLVPDFSENIDVEISGNGRLIGPNPVKAEGGVAAIWLASTTKAGEIRVTASAKGLANQTFTTISQASKSATVRTPDIAPPASQRGLTEIKAIELTTESGKAVAIKSASVSSTLEGTDASSLIDGDTESWWFASSNTNEWVQLELESPTTLSGSLIIWEKDSTWYTFSISVSADGKNWKQVYQDVQTGHNEEREAWHAKQVRFVKIQATKTEPSDSLLGIREISLFSR